MTAVTNWVTMLGGQLMLVLWTSLRWLVGLVGLYRPLAIWNPGHFSFSEFALVGACLCVLAVTSVLCVCGVNPVNAFFRIKWAPHDVVSQFLPSPLGTALVRGGSM